MKTYLLFCFLLSLTFFSFGQAVAKTQSQISLPNEHYVQMINEVYGTDYPPEEIRKDLIVLLNERISFVVSPAVSGKDYPLLTSLELRNSRNNSILPFTPGQFDLSSFNPLRYDFNFFDSKNYQTFRIDGTDYIMTVSPLHY